MTSTRMGGGVRVRTVVTLTLAVAGIPACGGASPEPVDPVPVTTPTPVEPAETGPAPAHAEGGSRHGYPASPLTPLADDVTDLALAVLRGQTPPATIPTQDGRPPTVRYQGDVQPSGEITPVFFVLEVLVVLRTDAQPAPPAPANAHEGAVKVLFLLGPTGMRVGEIRTGSAPRTVPGPTASFLQAGADAGAMVHAAIRQGRLEEMMVGRPELELLADGREEMLTRIDEVLGDIRRPLTDEGLAALANLVETPLGFDFDDLGLIGRDPSGHLFQIRLDLDRTDGGHALDRHIDVRPMQL